MNNNSHAMPAVPKQDKFVIELPDYSVPSFISGATKEYVGSKEDIDTISRGSENIIAKSVFVLAENCYSQRKIDMEFINTYGFDHSIKADELNVSVLYLKNGGQYLRCIKAQIKNMAIGINKQYYYRPESPMGNPDVIYVDDNWFCSRLYTIERVYKDRQECLYDIDYPSKIDFRNFLLDIFGDG